MVEPSGGATPKCVASPLSQEYLQSVLFHALGRLTAPPSSATATAWIASVVASAGVLLQGESQRQHVYGWP